MLNVLVRWTIPLAALLVLGPLAAIVISHLRAADGSGQVSLLVSTTPLRGIVGGLIALALALAAGIAGARFIEQRSGLLAAGLVLAWAAWNTGRMDRVLALTHSRGTLYSTALEAAIFGLLAVVVAAIIFRVPTRMPRFIVAGDATRVRGERSHHEPTALFDRTAATAFAAAAIGAAIGGWIVAVTTLKGQTFAAAVTAGLLAAVAGRLASQRVTPAWFVLGLVAVAVIGPVAATFVHAGDLGPTRAALAGKLLPLARPMPLDWIAGAFVGIPLGLWWAGSLIEKHER